MGVHRHGSGVRADRNPPRRRLVVALSVLALVASISAPVATAGSRGSGFGGLARGERSVGEAQRAGSMLAVAREAARHPRTDAAPTLDIPTPDFGTAAGPERLTPLISGGAPTSPRPLIVLPEVESSTTFAGLTTAEAGNFIPADPWVAANSSFVIQAVNSAIRVSNRAGTAIMTVPNEAFFALSPGHFATDPRVIWDAAHGKWVAVAVFVAGDLSDNGFVLAVSDGADPTQGWNLWPVFFGPYIPDYPSLASSNDKIVIADNLFDSSLVFQGLDLNTFKWSEVLAGTNVVDRYCDDTGFVHPRAAQVLSSTNDVHVVMTTADSTASQYYVRVTGAGTCAETTDLTDLTGLGFFALSGTGFPVPDPRQPGPDTIDNATDGRFTDAVWKNNVLYWVNTAPYTYDFGATWNDQVVVWATNTTPGSGSPSGFSYHQVLPGDGVDAYMGGIGLTRSGVPIVTYSQSSYSDPIAFYANRIVSPGAPGSIGTPLLLDTSEGSVSGERWGDYVGVAMDPVGTGSVWVSNTLAAADGTWRSTVARLLVDGDTPTAPSAAPKASPVTGTKLGLVPKFKLTWGTATDASSGTVLYRLEENVGGAGFTFAGLYNGTSATRALGGGQTHQFRVAAVDPLGNQGPYVTGPVLQILVANSPTSKTGTWRTQTASVFQGGSTWYATGAGASATYKTTGVRAFAFVTTKAATRGKFKVYIDGVLKGTFTAYSTTTAHRQVVYQFTFPSAGTHTIKIVVVGGGTHPRVDFDAILLLK